MYLYRGREDPTRVSRSDLGEEEVQRRINALSGLESGSISLEVIVEPFRLEVPLNDDFADFAAFRLEPPLLGQELDPVMLGLLEPTPPSAPKTGKAEYEELTTAEEAGPLRPLQRGEEG